MGDCLHYQTVSITRLSDNYNSERELAPDVQQVVQIQEYDYVHDESFYTNFTKSKQSLIIDWVSFYAPIQCIVAKDGKGRDSASDKVWLLPAQP